MIMEKPRSLKKMLAEKQVFAACVWDYMSSRAAEKVGSDATLLASGALSPCEEGYNDLGLVTLDEFVWETERITDRSPLPLILDAENGFGDSPLHAYRTCQRLMRAGAQAIQMEDSKGIRGFARLYYEKKPDEVTSQRDWLAKIRASKAALEGTDCILIARTEALLTHGLDEAIERCLRAYEAGADMTLIMGINNGEGSLELCKEIAKHIPGWKMYPDIESHNGIPDVNIDDLIPLGFNLVTCHYLEKAAWYGMLDYGRHMVAERGTLYVNEHDMGGLTREEKTAMMGCDIHEWLAFEQSCYQEDDKR